MKNIRHILTALMFATAAVAASAQTQMEIPGTNIAFALDGTEWKFLKTIDVDKNTKVHLFSYKAELLVDADGEETLPYLKIYVQKNYKKSVYEFVYDRYLQQPYQTIDEYSSGYGLPAKGGLGYTGIYTSPQDDKNYMFRMNCTVIANTAVEFRIETTQNNYGHLERRIADIFNTLEY
ncbi:MAG: hypothetical protein IJ789_01070 [Bacteroidales bacterium]|nr:hypothetical protein [Bacteroidales bacterium]